MLAYERQGDKPSTAPACTALGDVEKLVVVVVQRGLRRCSGWSHPGEAARRSPAERLSDLPLSRFQTIWRKSAPTHSARVIARRRRRARARLSSEATTRRRSWAS